MRTSLPDGIQVRTEKNNNKVNRTYQTVFAEIASALEKNSTFDNMKSEEIAALYEEELVEFLDSPEVLAQKVKKVAAALRNAKHTVVYTGAGVSTSAKIPGEFLSSSIYENILTSL